jgi:hypothetical protein
MFDPISLVVGGTLLVCGWFMGRLGRRSRAPKPLSTVCSCSHGYGIHEDGKRCVAAVERAHYYSNGSRNGYEWAQCACLCYDGPEPLPRVWTEDLSP